MRKVKTGIIIIIALFALAFTVAACSSGSSRQTLRDKGMVCAILDCAGGSIDGEPKKELYQIPPAYLPRPGSLIEIPEPMRANYTLIGWFLGERNADGDIVYGAEWDFSVDKMTEDITLYAMWRESFYFDFYYADAPDTLVETKRGISLTAAAATPERTGHTYTGDSYFDAAKQLPVAYPFTPAEGSGLHIAIFTEWVEGDYIIVRAPADLNGANVSANYYLMNDLDFAAAANWTVRDSYTGILDGNGYTIRNLTAANANLLFDSYGLFGKLVGATVRNLTFASCRLSAVVNTSRGQMRFGVLAGAADANTRVKNVALVDCTAELFLEASYSSPVFISDFIGQNGGAQTDGCEYSTARAAQFRNVSTASDFLKAVALTEADPAASINVNILADLDFGAAQSEWKFISEAAFEIRGNGHKIKNARLTETLEAADVAASDTLGLFGSLKGAKISGVTFESCSVTVTLNAVPASGKFFVGLLAGYADGGTALTGLTATGCSVTVVVTASGVDLYTGQLAGENAATILDCDFNGVIVSATP